MDKLKVFFDASPATVGYEGVPVFARETIRHLAEYSEIELHSGLISISPGEHKKYRAVLNGLTGHRVKYHSLFFPGRYGGKIRGMAFCSRKYDVVHCSTHYVPPHCAFSDFSNVILSVHDMFLWHEEYQFDNNNREKVKKRIAEHAEKALAIVTMSEFSKREINKFLGIPMEKIYTVPLATQWSGRPEVGAETSREVPERALKESTPYFMSVSTLYPHKNHIALLTAFNKYHHSPDYGGEKLVIVGNRKLEFPEIYNTLVNTPDVIHLQNVPENDLRSIYKNSKGFFLVSKLEGFGIPLLEAMSSKVPACYGKGSAMDEIGRDAAWGVDPDDIDAIAELFARFSGGGDEIDRRVDSAYNISLEYSYQKTVDTYVNIYRKLCFR